MGESLSTTGTAAAATAGERLVVVPSVAPSAVLAALGMFSATLLMRVVHDATGSRPDHWSDFLWVRALAAIFGGLVFAFLAPRDMRSPIVVAAGFIEGPSGRDRARIDLRQLDRAQLEADLGSRWRRARGFWLRSNDGTKIGLNLVSLRRIDRERLLRALGVAPAAPR